MRKTNLLAASLANFPLSLLSCLWSSQATSAPSLLGVPQEPASGAPPRTLPTRPSVWHRLCEHESRASTDAGVPPSRGPDALSTRQTPRFSLRTAWGGAGSAPRVHARVRTHRQLARAPDTGFSVHRAGRAWLLCRGFKDEGDHRSVSAGSAQSALPRGAVRSGESPGPRWRRSRGPLPRPEPRAPLSAEWPRNLFGQRSLVTLTG